MDLKIDIKLLVYLIAGFIVATIVGTVSHEFGHFLMAEYYGLEAKVHYGYTNWHRPETVPPLTLTQRFLISFGGPLQTLLTGCLGLGLIYIKRASFKTAVSLHFQQWVMVFMSLFWLRFLFNFLQSVPRWIQKGSLTGRSDEIRMARMLNWPTWSVSMIFAMIGLLVLSFVILKVVPRKERFSFILSGLIGGSLGFFLWLEWLGEMVMP